MRSDTRRPGHLRGMSADYLSARSWFKSLAAHFSSKLRSWSLTWAFVFPQRLRRHPAGNLKTIYANEKITLAVAVLVAPALLVLAVVGGWPWPVAGPARYGRGAGGLGQARGPA
jgi:hypothetical protein